MFGFIVGAQYIVPVGTAHRASTLIKRGLSPLKIIIPQKKFLQNKKSRFCAGHSCLFYYWLKLGNSQDFLKIINLKIHFTLATPWSWFTLFPPGSSIKPFAPMSANTIWCWSGLVCYPRAFSRTKAWRQYFFAL